MSSSGPVLVAEDDRDLRDIIAAFLEAKGWQVVALGSRSATVGTVWLERFTAAVLDVRSCASAGFKLLEVLRATSPSLPVIVIASFGDVQVSRRARAMGAADVLEKPFALEDLELTLDRLEPAPSA